MVVGYYSTSQRRDCRRVVGRRVSDYKIRIVLLSLLGAFFVESCLVVCLENKDIMNKARVNKNGG